jgi:hypothetical protein
VVHNPLNGILPLMIVPLLTIIIKGLKRKRTSTAASAEAGAPAEK